jgi:hypothetical protein
VIGIVCLAALTWASTTTASARSLYIGISADIRAWGSPGKEQDRVAETGAKRLREDLEWERIEPQDGQWEWSETDDLYRTAAEHGMTILPLADSPPCWAVPAETAREDCGQTYPVSNAAYAEFVARSAARYGPGGEFWKAHPGLNQSLAPRYFEIWNEPYFPSFTNGDVDPARYAGLYKAAVVAGRKANPETRYLVESAVDVPNPEGEGWVNWAAGMVKAEPAIRKYIDGIAVHPYADNHDPGYEPANGTDSSFKNTDLIYEDWVEQGINRPIWITEVGYASCNDGAERCVPGQTQATREEQKSEWLRDLFDELGEEHYGFVHAVYLYNFREWGVLGGPNDQFAEWFGILNDESERLPAWYSFANAVGEYDGVPLPNTVITSTSTLKGPAAFHFSVSDPTATTECQLDAGSWTPCSRSKTYTGLEGGVHTFQVRGTNAEGTESSPAIYSWFVLPVLDGLTESEDPLSRGGKWSALSWDSSSSTHKTGYVVAGVGGGWRPYDASPAVNGAYRSSATFSDGGHGDASSATTNSASASGYAALWLNMPSPGTGKSGYRLRWGPTKATVTLSKWTAGTETVLASKSSVLIPVGTMMEITDTGSVVSAWTAKVSSDKELTPLLTARDSTYSSGYAGIEGSGTPGSLINFRAGRLP